LESRKDQLQKQIIEALKANDNDLYSLLKSQWAHRFGVESLEELKNLDLSQLNQNPSNLSNQKMDQLDQQMDQLQENSFEGNKEIILIPYRLFLKKFEHHSIIDALPIPIHIENARKLPT